MRIKKDLMRMEWQGNVFLIPSDAGENSPKLALNETADRLLRLLTKERSRAELLEKLKAEYEVDEASLQRDLDEFLEQLKRLNLLEE